jgi:predicted DNA-binding protein (UPF0278 family)
MTYIVAASCCDRQIRKVNAFNGRHAFDTSVLSLLQLTSWATHILYCWERLDHHMPPSICTELKNLTERGSCRLSDLKVSIEAPTFEINTSTSIKVLAYFIKQARVGGGRLPLNCRGLRMSHESVRTADCAE